MGAPGFERGISRSAVESSTTKLYTPYQRAFTLRSVGTDMQMLCLEIYGTGQIIPAFEILKNCFSSLKKSTPGFESGTSRSAVECSTTELYQHLLCWLYPHVSKPLLFVP
ncbi:hypothetical protein TNCV_4959291 [Trichonephila clavipes]|uniref:Uncharacterized protein n=1 Tax=Trichonephila clavipes TaxID=2585209 RepID=A0A8X6SH28_TRICX|nr:hypothetical protein TNCV_4959291 [Trichonephila clavipes]